MKLPNAVSVATGKKGVMSIREDNWLITPIDNLLYFFFGMVLLYL